MGSKLAEQKGKRTVVTVARSHRATSGLPICGPLLWGTTPSRLSHWCIALCYVQQKRYSTDTQSDITMNEDSSVHSEGGGGWDYAPLHIWACRCRPAQDTLTFFFLQSQPSLDVVICLHLGLGRNRGRRSLAICLIPREADPLRDTGSWIVAPSASQQTAFLGVPGCTCGDMGLLEPPIPAPVPAPLLLGIKSSLNEWG